MDVLQSSFFYRRVMSRYFPWEDWAGLILSFSLILKQKAMKKMSEERKR